MALNSVIYRGRLITTAHTKGCYIRGRFYKPNGTGAGKLLGSKVLGKIQRFILDKLPTDIYQEPASDFHDVMCEIGGSEADFLHSGELMYKIALSHLKDAFSIMHPLYHGIKFRLWQNKKIVTSDIGRSAFNFNADEFPEFSIIKPIRK